MREKGSGGEALAMRYLQNKGYQILDRNWIFQKAELDIICQHQDQLIVVEVKTRSRGEHGHPSEAVTNKKIAQIIKLSAYWHCRLCTTWTGFRFVC